MMGHPVKCTDPNKIGTAALVLTAAVFAVSACSAYLYWRDDPYSAGVPISVAIMSMTAISILILAWTLGRHRKAEERSEEVVYLRMVRGPRRALKEDFPRQETSAEDENLKGHLNQ